MVLTGGPIVFSLVFSTAIKLHPAHYRAISAVIAPCGAVLGGPSPLRLLYVDNLVQRLVELSKAKKSSCM